MNKRWIFLSQCRFKLIKLFSHSDTANERKLFGLGQFVLLLTLTPFIFDLSLYSFSTTEKIPAHYEINPNRFESLPPYPGLPRMPKKPLAPKQLSKKERQLISACNNTKQVKYLVIAGWIAHEHVCSAVLKRKQTYDKENKDYQSKKQQYDLDHKKYLELAPQSEKAEQAYQNFKPSLSTKPKALEQDVMVKLYAHRSLTAIVNSTLAINTWQHITTPIWVIGLLLIFPTVWLTIKGRYWGLLVLGLSVPAMNYLFFIFSFIPSFEDLLGWQTNSNIVAQIGFFWFAMRGKLQSRSFALFIVLITVLALWPNVLADSALPVLQSLLPILVFITAALVARLIVKGITENAYLFKKLGWLNNLRKAMHTLVLWIPLGLLAIPFFYVTEIAIPQKTVHQLHKNNVLIYDAEHDVLDNALISTATKADDLAFSWHLSAEETKLDIYHKATRWENIKLSQKMMASFDQIMPTSLEFEEVKTGIKMIGWAIDIGIKESQQSTNKAYQKLRSDIRSKLKAITEDYDQAFKASINKSKTEALALVDSAHQKGLASILEANEQAQNTLWWTINYMQTMHQLMIFIFAFICLKSLLYVFSRVSFNRNTGAFVTLGQTEGTSKNQPLSIRPTGHHYLISAMDNQHFYISRRYQCRGMAPNFTIPQPISAPIARLFNGAYAMNKVMIKQGDDAVSCSATQGMEFFEWTLAADESIVFDFHHFVGMSSSIKLSTLISTRASSLLLGKMIYSQATGPGKLILMAKGRAEVIESTSNVGSLPPERLIAMQTDTRFFVDSELDVVNIYLSTAYVRPAGNGHVIVDVDSQRGNRTGLGSFIKRFILPL